MHAVPDRKLTTILSADVAGYSRLMEQDEPGTFARLKAYRDSVLEKIVSHRGRVVNTAGDSVLAEFSSVVNAVDCAVRIQRDIAERNADVAAEDRMQFRIGINLGDVMVDGDDLFGAGVNIAARLQALADSGGVLVSGSVFEQVRNKLTLGFDFLGVQEVKNISEAVPAYRVLLGGVEQAQAAAPRPSPPPIPSVGDEQPASDWPRSFKRRAVLGGFAIAICFVVNMATWGGYPWFLWPTLGISVGLGLQWVVAKIK
ncbi:MAG: adenylate/guanylate cyclase protein [Alphaproteobacteria bacterium]|jgi:class 3 adenylate cyclase|nr:adenylate/guanylate cyclase protein [Alphaproteobacteria bacterium]